MYLKSILFTTILLLFSLWAIPQNISVKFFEMLPNDQAARVTDPVTDQNGEKCALIKVVTNQTGFVWEGGMLGIPKIEKKTGEYWVYVPRGSKKITIKHDELGVLRDYIYPEAIKEATVYEMVLTTGEIKTFVEKKEITTQWLIIQTEPNGANVFIDGKLAGTTPFQRKYEEGEYTYRIEKNRYQNKAGKITLKDEKKRLNFTLKPDIGNIKVASAPEDGMLVYLDNENTGKKTPATLEDVSSGDHTLTLQSRWYQPQTKQVTVEGEKTTMVDFTLEKVFADITVKTQPSANIFIDGEKMGNGNWKGRLMEGIYTIKAEKDKYYSQSEQLEVIAGRDRSINFDLKGKTGSADIVTIPMDAEVYLDGEKQGTSPLTLNGLLSGEYKLKLVKEGYGMVTKTFTIREDESITLKETLTMSGNKEVTITSTPERAKVYINSELKGITPLQYNLSFGIHKIKIIKGERVVIDKINISRNGKEKFEFDVSEIEYFTMNKKGVNIKMVAVKGGTFQMGCTNRQDTCDHDEKPVHKVTVDDFLISKYEVTNEQFCFFLNEKGVNENGSYNGKEYIDMDANDCQIRYSWGRFVPKRGKENYPVIEVTWYGAQAFCKYLGGRLPTEAEWEFAARGGNRARPTIYAGSDNINNVAWYSDNSGRHTHEVGIKYNNELGIYDMSGNVWEWCYDWYSSDYYSNSIQVNPQGPISGSRRAMRGGDWSNIAGYCRVTDRSNYGPGKSFNFLGFRFSQEQ